MNIADLADAAGVTRRAVHFYINRGLLPPALSRGRGAQYDSTHLARLREILRLQAAGHSLEAIARLLAVHAEVQRPAVAEEAPGAAAGVREGADSAGPAEPISPARLQAQLLIRLRLAEGVELVLDTARYNPDAAQLLALRECVLAHLARR